jgi:hypothetical protein
MKVALAPSYRTWMLALIPTTLGVGTAALWLRSLKWPLRIDAAGLTLRYHGWVDWRSVRKIGVSRSYLDGHVSQIRIHHEGGGVSKISVQGLQDGQKVVRTILAMFEQAHRLRALERNVEAAARAVDAGRDSQTMPARRHFAPAAESRQGNERLKQEFAGLEFRRRLSVLAQIGERT